MKERHVDNSSELPLPNVWNPENQDDWTWLSETIGSIYDCVLDPVGWVGVLKNISEKLYFGSALFAVIQTSKVTQNISVNYNVDDEWIARHPEYLEDSLAFWGGAARVNAHPLDEPLVGTQVVPRAEWHKNRYFRDILEPRRVTDSTVIGIAREADLIGYAGFNRVDTGAIREEEVECLRLISPHMRRAVTISNFFDLKAVEARMLGSVLDALQYAVFLVSGNLRILHANRAAEAMLVAGQVMHASRDRLKVRSEIAAHALEAALQVAATNEAAMGQRGIAIPARTREGATAILHVLPLLRRELRTGLTQGAVAAVFVVDGNAASYSPLDAIAALYDLTPTESRIFGSLAEGRSLEDTAVSLGIAKSTARTHLLRIFDKTGCSRQAELVALAARHSVRL